MSKRKTERLLGLVVCLLSTTRYLTAEQVREAVPGYPEQDELFKRMFERDKEDLRDLGVPLETGVNHPFDDDPGYRIRQQAYQLPELRLEADEAAVLGLAARVWRRSTLGRSSSADHTNERSASPEYVGGVWTQMNANCAPSITSASDVVKRKRPLSRPRATTSSRPGSWNGICPARSLSTFSGSTSTQAIS